MQNAHVMTPQDILILLSFSFSNVFWALSSVCILCFSWTQAPLVTNSTDTFSIDACVIRRGLLWLWGCRSLEDWPMLLQTRPRGSHFHGDGELHNRVDRWRVEGGEGGAFFFILCQWTPECVFSHQSPRRGSAGCGFDSGKKKEKHFGDLP